MKSTFNKIVEVLNCNILDFSGIALDYSLKDEKYVKADHQVIGRLLSQYESKLLSNKRTSIFVNFKDLDKIILELKKWKIGEPSFFIIVIIENDTSSGAIKSLSTVSNLNEIFMASTAFSAIQYSSTVGETQLFNVMLINLTTLLLQGNSFDNFPLQDFKPVLVNTKKSKSLIITCGKIGESLLSLARQSLIDILQVFFIKGFSLQKILQEHQYEKVICTHELLNIEVAKQLFQLKDFKPKLELVNICDLQSPVSKSIILDTIHVRKGKRVVPTSSIRHKLQSVSVARNPLVKQVVVYAVSRKKLLQKRLDHVLTNKLNLPFYSSEEVYGKIHRESMFYGSVDSCANYGFEIVNADVIIIRDTGTVISKEKVFNTLLLQLGPRSTLIVEINGDFSLEMFDKYTSLFKALCVEVITFEGADVSVEDVLLWKTSGTKSGYNFFSVHFAKESTVTDNITINNFNNTGDIDIDSACELMEGYLLDAAKFSIFVLERKNFEDVKKKYLACLMDLKESEECVVVTSGIKDLELQYGKYISNVPQSLSKTWLVCCDSSSSNLISVVHSIISSSVTNLKLLLLFENWARFEKEIGLYCMHYGTCFLASTNIVRNESHADSSFREASDFDGVSIILGTLQDENCENWPLYRWNPTLREGLKFRLDSKNLQKEIRSFVQADERLTLLSNDKFKLPEKFNSSLDSSYQRIEKTLKTQFTKMTSTFAGVEEKLKSDETQPEDIFLVILYGSDSGNGQTVAESLAKKAALSKLSTGREFNRISKIRVCEANEFDSIGKITEFDYDHPDLEVPDVTDIVDNKNQQESIYQQQEISNDYGESKQNMGLALKARKLVFLLVLSTAGQGEPTLNAKKFSDMILRIKDKPGLLNNMHYGMFGLGDSHYWGKNTAESELYFCKTAKDIDAKLEALSAKRVCETQYGDDQDDDGYHNKLSGFESELWATLKLDVPETSGPGAPQIFDDKLKGETNYLRGTIDEGLRDHTTLKMLPEDTKLTKFHGIYQQDLRSVREELDAKQLERAYSFMIRIGIPGGVCGVGQFLKMLSICEKYANKKLKLTTRQAFQVHGVVKMDLKKTMQAINRACMDTLAACGDVNRNVIANPYLHSSHTNALVNKLANELNVHLKPRTSAYHEIWLEKKPIFSTKAEEEPIYGKTYLPRKFKIAIAVPPLNDVDVFAHCLGFIAIVNSQGNLEGFNITIGGGMGTTHNNPKTYPKLSEMLGFVKCQEDNEIADLVRVAEAIVVLQRDHGDRINRKHARLKYTVEDMGVSFFRQNVQKISLVTLHKAREFTFQRNADIYGWKRSLLTNNWTYTMFVENGYIVDTMDKKFKTGLTYIAKFLHKYVEDKSNKSLTDTQKLTQTIGMPNFSMTANQNLIFGEISDDLKPELEELFQKFNLHNNHSNLRLHSMACVALPTCGLAMAEAQTYLPQLLTKVEALLEECGIGDANIVMRMTGCPNGCARPYVAEIAFIGKAPGQYNMLLGGAYAGNRLNKPYKEGVNETQILSILKDLFVNYARTRRLHEKFGDWCIREKIIAPTLDGKNFWSEGPKSFSDESLQIYW